MRCQPPDIADAVAQALAAKAKQDDAEHAVYGLDTLDELGLHPIIQQALTDAGFGVYPEQRYPGHQHKTKRSEGLRCDIVLTPNNQPLRDERIKDTLFDTGDAVHAQDAYWLEVKTVAQHETTGPFKRYSAELLAPVMKDIPKLRSDDVIHHAGLLLILFTEDQQVAEHDLAAWHQRCLQKGLPVAIPAIRHIPITDRIGNSNCSAAVFGVR